MAELKKTKEKKASDQAEERKSQKQLREGARQKKIAEQTAEREARQHKREKEKAEKRDKAVDDLVMERRLYGIVMLETQIEKTVRLYSKGYVQVYLFRRKGAKYEKLKRVSAQTTGGSGVLTVTTDSGTRVLRVGPNRQKYVDQLLRFESAAQTLLNDLATTKVTVMTPDQTSVIKDEIVDQIEKLTELRKSGVLTDEEFQTARIRLLHGD